MSLYHCGRTTAAATMKQAAAASSSSSSLARDSGSLDYWGVFRAIDTDNSGHISRSEFRDLLNKLELTVSHEELMRLLDKFDADGDGRVTYAEFLRFVDAPERTKAAEDFATAATAADEERILDVLQRLRRTVHEVMIQHRTSPEEVRAPCPCLCRRLLWFS